jgi:alpha-beta hydrolase superfamily lysophospholipase
MTLRRILLGGLAALLALALGFVVFVAWRGSSQALFPPFYEHRTPQQGLRPIDLATFSQWAGGYRDPRADLGLDFEDVELPGPGGATLRGWWVPGAQGATAGVVAVHGAHADRREFLRHVPLFHAEGYPVLLFDCREHGTSDGARRGISLGVRESEDVIAAVAWARRVRGLARVAVLGTSQGGASAILAAAADPRIDVVVAENPFTSVHELFRDFRGLEGREPVPRWIARLVSTATLWRIGGIGRPAPIDVVGAIAPRPLLLMHGTEDSAIPVGHSERLRDAAGEPVELWILEGARHAALYNAAPEEWRRRVVGFLARWLGPARAEGR